MTHLLRGKRIIWKKLLKWILILLLPGGILAYSILLYVRW